MYSKIPLLKSLEIKTTPLSKAAFASPKWFLSYISIFNIKTTFWGGDGDRGTVLYENFSISHAFQLQKIDSFTQI